MLDIRESENMGRIEREEREKNFYGTFLGRSLKALASPERFEIMLYIIDEKKAGFNQIKKEFGMTNGNLAHHLRYLEEAGLVVEMEDVMDKRRRFLAPTPFAERLIRYLFLASEVIPGGSPITYSEEAEGEWEVSSNMVSITVMNGWNSVNMEKDYHGGDVYEFA